jgi:YVTN family beta-propeller protein
MAGMAREREKAWPGRAWRAVAVLGMLALPLAAAGVTAVPAAAAATYAVTATIGWGSSPEWVAVDPSTHTVYVASQGGTVAGINEATNTGTGGADVGQRAAGVAVNPATHTVYVTNAGSSVSVINEATNTVTATIGVGRGAGGVAVDPATDTVYVLNNYDQSISVIDGATNTVTATIGVCCNLQAVAVDPSTNTVYVAAATDNTVSVIDGATNTVTATIHVGLFPAALAVDPSTRTVYVANIQGNTVSVIDGATNTVTATVGVGSNPEGVGVDPSTNTVYVTNEQGNTVSVIDGATNTVTATVGVGSNPVGVGVDPSTHAAYVANIQGNSVSVITTPPTVTGSTPVPASSGNPVTVAPTATFSQPVVPSSLSFKVKDLGGNTVAGSVSFNSSDTTATFTPSSALAQNITYTATVSGAKTIPGGTMSGPYSWTFSTVGSQCPCSIFPSTAQPALASSGDTSSANLGVQFTPSANGWIAGIRFYKGSANTGTHIGELWTASGTLLGQVTFTSESASGWQEADFSTPVAVTAGTTYVASYFDPNGNYAYTAGGLASAVTNGPLTAPTSSSVSPGNGVYNYSGFASFPGSTYNAANYWVDVDFTMTPGAFPPTVTDSTPGTGSRGNPVTAAPTATFSQAVVPGSVSFTLKDSGGNQAAGSVSFNSAGTVATFTPASALTPDTTYTATVSGAQGTSGAPMGSPYSWTFSTAGSQCPCSLWPSTAQPAVAAVNDTGAANLGVQFTPAADGWITGIRFYKGPGNTGTHTGELWTATGTLLGKVTFTGESASGWQEADFSTPVAVTSGTTYVASYLAPNGGYSYTAAGFASAGVTSGPLTAPQSSAVSGGNGVYSYGGSPAFPDATYNATNYWVDVVFTQP